MLIMMGKIILYSLTITPSHIGLDSKYMYLHLKLYKWLLLAPLYKPEQGKLSFENFEILAALNCFNASEFSLIILVTNVISFFSRPLYPKYCKAFFLCFSPYFTKTLDKNDKVHGTLSIKVKKYSLYML